MSSRVDAYTRFDSPDIYANAVAKRSCSSSTRVRVTPRDFGGTTSSSASTAGSSTGGG